MSILKGGFSSIVVQQTAYYGSVYEIYADFDLGLYFWWLPMAIIRGFDVTVQCYVDVELFENSHLDKLFGMQYGTYMQGSVHMNWMTIYS